MSTPKHLVFNAFLLLAVSACASLRGPEPEAGGFVLRGKLGIVQDAESFSARFLWQQQGPDFTIDLWGPLGQGRVQLAGSERRLELRDSDGSVISAGAPDTVMRQQLGWSLPLTVLPQWVQGQPARGKPVSAAERDAQGRFTAFRQLGWQVTVERYSEVAGGVRPHRVTASREGSRVRLAISDWRI